MQKRKISSLGLFEFFISLNFWLKFLMKQWFWSLVQNCVFEARNDVIMIGSNMEQIQTELIKSYHYRTTGFEGAPEKITSVHQAVFGS